jgi:hypothetical protein
MHRRAEIGYLVGYKTGNIWKVWFPRSNTSKYVRDAVFDENMNYSNQPKEPPIISQIPFTAVLEEEELEAELEQALRRLAVAPIIQNKPEDLQEAVETRSQQAIELSPKASTLDQATSKQIGLHSPVLSEALVQQSTPPPWQQVTPSLTPRMTPLPASLPPSPIPSEVPLPTSAPTSPLPAPLTAVPYEPVTPDRALHPASPQAPERAAL